MEIQVLDDPAAVVAELLVEAAAAGRHIVLTGGSTPRKAYERAAAAGADWSRATLWYGDDRCVAPDDPRSNHAMAKAALVDRLPADRRPEVLRMEGERGPDAGADAYEALVRERLGDEPRWDLLLLGLGPDAHCASLFPGQPAALERSRLVVGVPIAGWTPQVPRISMTLPCLNAARRVVFMVTGEDKAVALGRAFAEPTDVASPAAHVRPPAGELLVLCDAAAAKGLER
jgi:6-phosphogluconolactonase